MKLHVWVCECGQEAFCVAGEAVTSVGKAIFRKQGCQNCRRPMQLSNSFGKGPVQEEVPA